MLRRYKVKRKGIYYVEEKTFNGLVKEFIWVAKLKLSGWKIEKLGEL